MDTHTVLVVDDDPVVGRALARLLKRRDRRIVACEDPYAALAMADREPVDLVISDKEMPGMNGLALLAALRRKHPQIVRILMTGHPSLESALEATNQEEVYRYITKPWDNREMEETVSAALARLDELRRAQHAAGAAERRARLLEELAREHPGLVDVGEGVHRPVRTVASERVGELVGLFADGGGAAAMEATRAVVEAACAVASAVAIADALVMLPVRHVGSGVVLEPMGSGHQVSIELGAQVWPLLALPRGMGDTVAARLALLAGLDVSAPGQQLGRRTVAVAAVEAELMVSLRTSALGLSAELRRLVQGPGEKAASTGDGEWTGRYRLLGVLGEGGGGKVYRAVDSQLERPVALKVLRGASARDPLAVSRFLREARAASRARHPGIVEVLDYGQLPDGRPFLVMELVEAATLEQRLCSGPLAPADAIKVARGMAAALHAAHAAGVVHRDLKPANVFVDDELAVKIADFGAAKLVGALGADDTQEGLTIGTPHYMSPEHAQGMPVDRRTDIYALGCVLHEMLSGAPPYDAETPREILLMHVSAAVPAPTAPSGPLPLALTRAIQRAMAKNPAERHQNGSELIADLDQATASLGRTGWRRWLP